MKQKNQSNVEQSRRFVYIPPPIIFRHFAPSRNRFSDIIELFIYFLENVLFRSAHNSLIGVERKIQFSIFNISIRVQTLSSLPLTHSLQRPDGFSQGCQVRKKLLAKFDYKHKVYL